MLEYAWLIPVLPAAAFLLILFLGKRTWEQGAGIAIAGVGGSFLLYLGVVRDVLAGAAVPFGEARDWFTVGSYTFELGVYVDNLSLLMLLVVSLISTLIVIYSAGYMHGDPGRRRYYAEMCLFVASMEGLVLADNLLLVFLTWEGVGLCSYLLIGYWYEKHSAAQAARKAFLVTRVGDIFLLLGLIVLLREVGTLNFVEMFEAAERVDPGVLTVATLLVFGGAVGKSAQFPLHVWLPDAMEGPTTVSALIHAATMVKAGVYLVARMLPLFVLAPHALLVVAVIGAVTALLAASMAVVEYDIKRVLAYSTVSQLAYMFLGLGTAGLVAAAYTGSMFHLTTHAFTKALLFLAAGSVIHAVHSNDMRDMGGLRRALPITSVTMLVGAVSMAGLPPLSIFWSKDELLGAVWEAGQADPAYRLLWIVGIATALLTAFYMFRLVYLTFFGEHRGHGEPHESPRIMTAPLQILAVFAALVGVAAFAPGFARLVNVVTLGHIEAEHFHAVAGSEVLAHMAAAPLTPLASILVAVGGVLLARRLYAARPLAREDLPAPEAATGLRRVLVQRYYMDHLYNGFADKVVVGYARLQDWFDRNVVDGAVNGISWSGIRGSERARRSQSGRVQDYASWVVAGFLAILIFALNHAALARLWNERIAGLLLGGGP